VECCSQELRFSQQSDWFSSPSWYYIIHLPRTFLCSNLQSNNACLIVIIINYAFNSKYAGWFRRCTSTSLCEKKKFLWTCVWFSAVTEIVLFDSANTEALWMILKKEELLAINFNFNVMVKWQIYYTEITNLLQFTTNVWKSHCQAQCTLHVMYRDCMLFVWVDIHVSLCRQQHP
jgi:hypothetical protein